MRIFAFAGTAFVLLLFALTLQSTLDSSARQRAADEAYFQAQRQSILIEQERMRLERERWSQMLREQAMIQAQNSSAPTVSPVLVAGLMVVSLALGGLVVAVTLSHSRRRSTDEVLLTALLMQPRREQLRATTVMCRDCLKPVAHDARFCSACGATVGTTILA